MSTYDLLPHDRLMYGVVLNDLDLTSWSPGGEDIGSGWTLRRASDDEISRLRPELVRYAAASPGFGLPDQEFTISPSGSGYRYSRMQDAAQWRYAVVTPPPDEQAFGARLAEALRISEPGLVIELWCARNPAASQGPGLTLGGSPGQCSQFFHRMMPTSGPTPVDVDALRELVQLRFQLDEEEFTGIVQALETFRRLDDLPRHSDQTLLGHLSVLEGLLTHRPADHDPVDSITRQLRRNLILIDHRLDGDHRLGLHEFDGAAPTKVISQLYAYRSAIAHGGDGTQALQWFEARRPPRWEGWWPKLWLHEHARQMVQKVLVGALREPRLITDLHG